MPLRCGADCCHRRSAIGAGLFDRSLKPGRGLRALALPPAVPGTDLGWRGIEHRRGHSCWLRQSRCPRPTGPAGWPCRCACLVGSGPVLAGSQPPGGELRHRRWGSLGAGQVRGGQAHPYFATSRRSRRSWASPSRWLAHCLRASSTLPGSCSARPWPFPSGSREDNARVMPHPAYAR
jgi:hypothetical protein